MKMEKNILQILETSGSVSEQMLSASGFTSSLIEVINELIENDFNRLIQMLYRLDISESKLKKLLQTHKNTDAAEIIADLIIERQLEKIKSRRAYKQRDSDIDENEKW